ncbi:MAG: CHASE2 domain-containing protein [Betaproteobacteria bacterium]
MPTFGFPGSTFSRSGYAEMNRTQIWKSEWFPGVAVATVVFALPATHQMRSLKRKAYEAGVRVSNRAPNDKIVVIAVDDNSIANLGRWPWPRHIHAQMINRRSAAHAKVIGYAVFFAEPRVDSAKPDSEQYGEHDVVGGRDACNESTMSNRFALGVFRHYRECGELLLLDGAIRTEPLLISYLNELYFPIPKLAVAMGAAVTGALLVVLLSAPFVFMTNQLVWVQLMSAALLLVLGYLVLATKRFLIAERGKVGADYESAPSNRTLGLALHGQRDVGFDRFKRCPLNPQLTDDFYNLALDFERKRLFSKAEAVLQHVSSYNPRFRDLQQCLARARGFAAPADLDSRQRSTNASTLMLGGGAMKRPMLTLQSE